MKNCAAFQAQLASIMEVLAKAAVAEISKLVEDGSVILRLEVSRSHKEIDCLKRKLQQVESELRTAQEAATHDNRSIGVQVEDQFGEGFAVREETAAKRHPFEHKHCEEDSGAQSRNTRPVFGFMVKAEQEEEHIAQGLNQAGCEHSTGRLNTLDSEYGMYERDIQKWNSFTQGNCNIEINDPVCSNATELCSQGQTVSSPLQHTPATMEVSGSTLFLESDFLVVDGDVVKEEAGGQCSYNEESRSEMGGTQQTRFTPPPVLMNNDLTSQLWQPLQQPSDWQIGVTGGITNPVSNNSKKTRIHWKTGPGDKPYGCTQCEKSFCRFIDLERHRRIHTGEKPFGCAQCGKRFSLRGNLITHERVHTGNKPFGCVHCGKRFAQGSNLRAHHRIHTGERPYHCTQCGKRFTQLSALKTHLKVHSRNELLQFGMNCV